jgi:stalled ribosome rescue protein Dom34
MKITKRMGIWMDHASAHTIEFNGNTDHEIRIVSRFTPIERQDTLGKGENRMHNKEQQQQHDFYKKIAEEILSYSNVLLFGPTQAKNELQNLIKADHRFDHIRITVESAGKLSESQQQAFVNDFFSKQLE